MTNAPRRDLAIQSFRAGRDHKAAQNEHAPVPQVVSFALWHGRLRASWMVEIIREQTVECLLWVESSRPRGLLALDQA